MKEYVKNIFVGLFATLLIGLLLLLLLFGYIFVLAYSDVFIVVFFFGFIWLLGYLIRFGFTEFPKEDIKTIKEKILTNNAIFKTKEDVNSK